MRYLSGDNVQSVYVAYNITYKCIDLYKCAGYQWDRQICPPNHQINIPVIFGYIQNMKVGILMGKKTKIYE